MPKQESELWREPLQVKIKKRQLRKIINNNIFNFDASHLFSNIANYRTTYENNHPFPHIVIDNFLQQDVLENIISEFPSGDESIWKPSVSDMSVKKYCDEEWNIPENTRKTIRDLQSEIFLLALAEITGIIGLIPDNYLFGSGLFRIERGGFLKVHADFNVHPVMMLDRRINLLLYLNDNWKDEYGGNIDLWEQDKSALSKSIPPIANRCVIFSTTDTSFHGHPHPLSCPPGRSRNCISLYYYTNGRPEKEQSLGHNTIWI
jgi:Rps23 Pro-64 3,4-dihydroxylase Tpa1-like proline 4-hydroxylase